MSKLKELHEKLNMNIARQHLDNFISNEAYKFNRRKIDVIYHYLNDNRALNKLKYQL